MQRRHLFVAGACALAAPSLPCPAFALTPNVPVELRLYVGFSAGGATDLLARRLQPILEKRGHRLVIENIPGGGSTIALNRVALAPADGRTLGFASGTMLSLIASGEVPLRLSQFSNLVRISQDPSILVVGASSPLRTLEDVITAIRAERGAFSAGAAGPEGSLGNLTLNAFVQAIGGDYIYVAYPGASRIANELMGRHLGAGLVKPADVFGQIRSGELRPVVQFAEERLRQMPQIPTAAERGINVFPHGRMVQMTYLVASTGTAAPVKEGLVTLFREAVLSPEFQAAAEDEAFLADGIYGEPLEAAVMEMFRGFQAAYARQR